MPNTEHSLAWTVNWQECLAYGLYMCVIFLTARGESCLFPSHFLGFLSKSLYCCQKLDEEEMEGVKWLPLAMHYESPAPLHFWCGAFVCVMETWSKKGILSTEISANRTVC